MTNNATVSCSVKLGETHVLCCLKSAPQEGSTIHETAISVQLQIARSLQQLSIRREIIEENETQLKSYLAQAITQAYAGQKVEVTFQFNVLSDDGNLLSAAIAGASDLLRQSAPDTTQELWACMLMLYENVDGTKQWLVDPSHEECSNLSNCLVLVTRVGSKTSV